MQLTKLNILPQVTNTVETYIEMETINYEYGGGVDEHGDRDVIDVSRTYTMRVSVPKISFLNWILTLCILKDNGVLSSHMYNKQFVPYMPNSPVWGYFDQVRGNLLTNGSQYRNVDKVRIYIYWIEEFNYFAILRIQSHQDIVSYSINESEHEPGGFK